MQWVRLFKQIFVYGFSSVFVRGLNFLLTPLYTYFFLPAHYAIITDFYAVMAFLTVVLSFGLDSFYFRIHPEEKDEENQNLSTVLFNQCMSFSIVLATIFLALTLPNANLIATWMHYPGEKLWVSICIFILFIDAFSVLPLAILRSEEKALRFSGIQSATILINVLCNVLYFLIFKRYVEVTIFEDITAVLLINLISSCCRLLFLIPQFIKYTPVFNAMFWQRILHYTFPLMLVGLGGIINEVLDRQLLKYLLLKNHSETEALRQMGIYGAIYKFSIFISLITQAFRYTLEPFLLQMFGNPKNDEQLTKNFQRRLMSIYVGFLLFSSLTILFFQDLIKILFLQQEAYWEGLQILPILLLAQVVLGVYYQQALWYKMVMKTQIGAHITWIGVLITLIFNFLLIPKYGYVASAWITLGCYAVMLSMSYVWSLKHWAVSYDFKSLWTYFIVAVAFFSLINWCEHQIFFPMNAIELLILKIILLSSYVLMIFNYEKKFIDIRLN